MFVSQNIDLTFSLDLRSLCKLWSVNLIYVCRFFTSLHNVTSISVMIQFNSDPVEITQLYFKKHNLFTQRGKVQRIN